MYLIYSNCFIFPASCKAVVDGEEAQCDWNYSGQGLEYQILAGPIFVVIFTISGVIMGFLGDKFSRLVLIACKTFWDSIG